MNHTKEFTRLPLFTGIMLMALVACGRAPEPSTPSLEAQNFGTASDDIANDIANHSSGIYVVGATGGSLHRQNQGATDAFIRKYNTGGGLFWADQFGSSGTEYAEDVASDGNDNAYVVGFTTASLAGSSGGEDAFVRKYTPSKPVAWTKQFGSSSKDRAHDVAVKGNSIYVVGETNGSLPGSGNFQRGDGDGFLTKFSASGTRLWTRQFGTAAQDLANTVAVDPSGNVFVLGYTRGALGRPHAGNLEVFLSKYSPTGGLLWTNQYDSGGKDEQGVSLSLDKNRNIAVAALRVFAPNDLDVHVYKLNPSGVKIWEKPFAPVGHDEPTSISTDSSNNIYISGITRTSLAGAPQGGLDGFVIKLNPSGATLWSKKFGTAGEDIAQRVLTRSTADMYLVGRTNDWLGGFGHFGNVDAFLKRLDGASGDTVWSN